MPVPTYNILWWLEKTKGCYNFTQLSDYLDKKDKNPRIKSHLGECKDCCEKIGKINLARKIGKEKINERLSDDEEIKGKPLSSLQNLPNYLKKDYEKGLPAKEKPNIEPKSVKIKGSKPLVNDFFDSQKQKYFKQEERDTNSSFSEKNMLERTDTLSENARKHLSGLVDELWVSKYPNHSKALGSDSYDEYKKVRDSHYLMAALAEICGHERREGTLKLMDELQAAYIDKVKKSLKEVKKKSLEDLKLYSEEVKELSKTEEEFKKEWASISSKKDPTIEDLAVITEKQKKLLPLPEYRGKVEKAEKIIKSIDSVFNELEEILEMSPHDRINYLLLSAPVIVEGLQNGTYKGIPFESFDIFVSQEKAKEKKSKETLSVTASSLREKPPELLSFLEIKEAIDNFPEGFVFDSRELRKNLPENFIFSAKLAGNYVRELPDVWGIKVKDKKMIKTRSNPMSEEEFISRLLKDLKSKEQADINRFYLRRALERIRKNPCGYDPFSTKEVQKEIKNDGFIITRKAIGVNLGRYTDLFGLKEREDLREHTSENGVVRFYEFAEVIPTDSHIKTVKNAVNSLGYRPFNSKELASVIEKEFGIDNMVPARVLEYILANSSGEFGIAPVENSFPVKYMRKTRPKSASALIRSGDDEDMEELV